MKKIFGLIAVLGLLSLYLTLFQGEKKLKHRRGKPTLEKPFVIIIPSYNNAAYCEHNLMSVLNQNYKNFRVIYIDDASKDATYAKVSAIVNASPMKDRITLIHNENNQSALKNLYEVIHTCHNDEIVVTVDGDDFLAHSDVLNRLNAIYQERAVWMTYGNFLDYPSYKQKPLICKSFPKSVIRNNAFRRHAWISSHLRTFYAGLFKKIPKDDFLFKGKFLPMGWDLAFMLPMLEMSGKHFHFVDEVLYLYNRSNPINDHKVNQTLQDSCANYVRSLPPYTPLKTPPYE
jgi:glycosyltransferase involved in cell wall biosynthesis